MCINDPLQDAIKWCETVVLSYFTPQKGAQTNHKRSRNRKRKSSDQPNHIDNSELTLATSLIEVLCTIQTNKSLIIQVTTALCTTACLLTTMNFRCGGVVYSVYLSFKHYSFHKNSTSLDLLVNIFFIFRDRAENSINFL